MGECLSPSSSTSLWRCNLTVFTFFHGVHVCRCKGHWTILIYPVKTYSYIPVRSTHVNLRTLHSVDLELKANIRLPAHTFTQPQYSCPL